MRRRPQTVGHTVNKRGNPNFSLFFIVFIKIEPKTTELNTLTGKVTTMNEDCISTIAKFMQPSLARKLNVRSAVVSFPKKISLHSFEEIHQFYDWCRKFDTSNLEEVKFAIFDMNWGAPRDMVFGWVPPSVKVLRLSIYNAGVYQLPYYTVEELHLDHCDTDFHLPDSIRRLTLGKNFKGRIAVWPQQLEELTINGWMSEYGNDTIRLDALPDSIHTMFLTWGTAVEVPRWPEGLMKLTLETCEDDMMADWLGIEHAPVPEGVEFTHIEIEPVFRGQAAEDYEW